MSEPEETVIVDDTAHVEEEAKDVGWVPQQEFRGDPERWVDAATYLERGQTYIPFLKANNRKLNDELKRQQDEVLRTQSELRAVKAALDVVQTEVRSSTAEELTSQDSGLTRQIKEAREANDFDLEETLRTERDTVRQQLAKAKEKPVAPTAAGPLQEAPEYRQFVNDNPWFTADPVMQGAALSMMQTLAKRSDFTGMTMAQRYALLGTEMRTRFPDLGGTTRPTTSKVEGSRGGATGGGGGARSKGFEDLPADARHACDAMAPRFVGPTKKFKDNAAWRKEYASKYFQ